MPRQINEDRTRKEMIDPQLETAGWYLCDHSKVMTEIPVDGYDAKPWNGISDYTLYRENGDILAVAETRTKDLRNLQDFEGLKQTRTTMGLIDVFMRSNQTRRILFVADRDAQAI